MPRSAELVSKDDHRRLVPLQPPAPVIPPRVEVALDGLRSPHLKLHNGCAEGTTTAVHNLGDHPERRGDLADRPCEHGQGRKNLPVANPLVLSGGVLDT